MMNQRLLATLTVANLVLLIVLLGRVLPSAALGDDDAVLRGRGLEILDDQGKVRASIRVDLAHRAADGKSYPDTVMLRLIDPKGRPEVKLGASEQGAGLGLVGASDTTHALLEAEGAETVLKLTNDNGHQQVVMP